MCNDAAKQVSAGVAPCNMVGFVKPFRTSVARQVSRKVEPLSTSATARNGRSGEKHHFVNLNSFAVAHKFQLKVSTYNGGLTYTTYTYPSFASYRAFALVTKWKIARGKEKIFDPGENRTHDLWI